MNTYEIGVIQGRLLPKFKGRYQAHPIGYWQDEFLIARDLGLDLIEFILDYNDYQDNPLLTTEGLNEIKAVMEKTGVKVKTICADYFMEASFHNNTTANIANSQEVLKKLIINGAVLNATDIVIPCVDQSSLEGNPAFFDEFVKNTAQLISLAEKNHMNISLETDLGPESFARLLGQIKSPAIKVNYDTGNSASLGYKPDEELAAYGEYISDVHIKDRKLGGGSVELGSGDTDFDTFFNCLARVKYNGPFIMQAFRDDEGVEVFKRQLAWVKPRLEKYITERG
ncbi:MAG: sugar phosphate isomerase/epimerase [Syntrophomonadaceae bacterium]|nr:sugar phosphate isomerase/epimerase [Syntrophomonadaceae bacterium]